MDHKRVLVVDDDQVICMIIQAALQDEGFEVAAAVGPSALELAHRQPPDLILLDLVMKPMDGREIRRRLLTYPRTAAVPVVVISSDERARTVAREIRAQACLPKPFALDELVDLVRRETHAA
jgi:CheY-like chemotaxis protein